MLIRDVMLVRDTVLMRDMIFIEDMVLIREVVLRDVVLVRDVVFEIENFKTKINRCEQRNLIMPPSFCLFHHCSLSL